jgi:hypothetical protein
MKAWMDHRKRRVDTGLRILSCSLRCSEDLFSEKWRRSVSSAPQAAPPQVVIIESMASLKELLKPLAEDGAAMTREQAARTGRDPYRHGAGGGNRGSADRDGHARRTGAGAGRLCAGDARARDAPAAHAARARRAGGCCRHRRRRAADLQHLFSGAALVAAAAGAKVAKHGNRAVTSRCGTADVLEALGVPIALGPELAVECLRETGFMFLFAPLYHPAMKAVGPLRQGAGLQNHFQSLRTADQPGRGADSGDRRAGAQPRAAGGPHAGGAGGQASFCGAWDRRHRRADHDRRVGGGAR